MSFKFHQNLEGLTLNEQMRNSLFLRSNASPRKTQLKQRAVAPLGGAG